MDGGVVRMQLLVRPRACVVESASDARSSALVASRKYPGSLASVLKAHNLKIKICSCLCTLDQLKYVISMMHIVGNKSKDVSCMVVHWIKAAQRDIRFYK